MRSSLSGQRAFSLIKGLKTSMMKRAVILSGLTTRSAWLTLLAVAVFLFSRFLFLDQDLPVWALAFYQPNDELYYTISAFNLFHYGTWTHKVLDFLPPDEGPLLALQNLLTYFGLLLFGNNFFGLRSASVFCGVVVFAGTLWSVRRIPADDPFWKNFVVASAAIYMIVDYFFLQSSRVNDPTTFMMAATVGCMLLVSRVGNAGGLRSSLLLGFAAGVVVTFVYIYMVYVAAALGLTVLVCRFRQGWRRVLLHVLVFSGGTALAVGLFAVFSSVFFQVGLIDLAGRILVTGGVRADFVARGMFSYMIDNAQEAFEETLRHNLFLYNPALLMVYLSALPVFLLTLVRERRPIDVFVAACVAFRLLLSALIPFDYYEKKLIQVFPLVIYVVAHAAISARSVYRGILGGAPLWLVFHLVFNAFLAATLPDFLVERFPKLYIKNEFVASTGPLIVLGLWPLLLASRARLRAGFAVIVVLLLMKPGIRLDREFVYKSPTFQYRDSLIRAAPKLDGKILAGGLSYAVRLYNTSIPTMNFYAYYYYGREKFGALSRQIYEQKLADGTILFVPQHPAGFLKPIYDYANNGGLVLDEALDLKDVEEKYKFGIYFVPGGRQTSGNCIGDCGR